MGASNASRSALFAAAFVVAVTLVAGCGGTDESPEEAGSTGASSTSVSTTTTTNEVECRRPPVTGPMINTACASSDDNDDDDSDATTTTSTTTTTRPRRTTTTTTTTTTTVPEGPACEQSFDTQYIPANSWVTFERNGVQVSLRKLSTLAIEVTSSNGEYDGTTVEPTNYVYEGLQVTTTIGLDWVWDVWEERFVLKPGQVKAILRVWDCWDYVDGPDDLF